LLQLRVSFRVIGAMPMYYINLKGNGQHRPAEAPLDFLNLDVAKAEVLQSIRAAFDAVPEEYHSSSLRFFYEICDEDGVVLDVVTFREALVH
jgi:hypothetical protein